MQLNGQTPNVERLTDGPESPHGAAQRSTSDTELLPPPRRDGRFQVGNKAGAKRALRLVALDTPAKVRRVLWQVVADLRKGAMKADTGNATVNALRLLLQLYETEQQDVRLAEMNEHIVQLEAQLVERLGIEERGPLQRHE